MYYKMSLLLSRFSPLIFLFIFNSCEDVFIPEVDWNHSSLVVQAMLTTEQTYQKIVLTKTEIFTNKRVNNGLSGAYISLEDNAGNSFDFYDAGAGFYISNNKLKLKTGLEYKLNIVTPDGTTYESAPQILTAVAGLDSVFVTPAKSRISFINMNGEVISKEVNGFDININTSVGSAESAYMVYQLRGYEQYYITYLNRYADFPDSLIQQYCIRSLNYSMNNIVAILSAGLFKASHICNFCLAGYNQDYFMNYIPESPEGFSVTSKGFSGMLVEIRQLSVSKNVYEITKMMKEQIAADFRLFDPVMSQIQSNIICKSRPDKKVFGIFAVSDVSKRTAFIDFDGKDDVFLAYADSIPEDMEMTCIYGQVPPGDWVFRSTY